MSLLWSVIGFATIQTCAGLVTAWMKSGLIWPAESLRTLFRNKCTRNWSAGCTFALALCKARQQRTVFQWQTGRKEFRFCSIGTNSYMLFVFADHTGWRILSVNAAQRRIGLSKCLWQKLTIIHYIRILSVPSHTDDIKSFWSYSSVRTGHKARSGTHATGCVKGKRPSVGVCFLCDLSYVCNRRI